MPFVRCDDEGQRVEAPARRLAVVEQVDRGARFLELPARAFQPLAQAAAGQRADDAQDALPVIADRLLAGYQLVVRVLRRGNETAQRLHWERRQTREGGRQNRTGVGPGLGPRMLLPMRSRGWHSRGYLLHRDAGEIVQFVT